MIWLEIRLLGAKYYFPKEVLHDAVRTFFVINLQNKTFLPRPLGILFTARYRAKHTHKKTKQKQNQKQNKTKQKTKKQKQKKKKKTLL